MKKLSLLLFFFANTLLYAQEDRSTQIGQTTRQELQMTQYEKDPSAPAVILYDEENYFYTEYNKRKRVQAKDVYLRIKILKTDGLEFGSIIAYYNEVLELSQIEGVTYNLNENSEIITSQLQTSDIIKNVEENYTKYIFNLPNVQVGSVVELRYRCSNYSRSIPDFYFQTSIPKLKSRMSRLTPKTMNYIVNLTGLQKLSKKENKESVRCFKDRMKSLKCRFAAYEMEHVPAFKKEPFMPHESNLKSKLSFRLSYFVERGLFPYEMMSKWSDFDKAFKSYFFNKEMTKKNMYSDIIPSWVFKQGTKLDIAKNIYYRIQNHFSWNGRESGDLNRLIRQNVRSREGSLDLIATTLYNALQAADIECYYVAVSTRSKGPIDYELPYLRNFDYTVIKAVIDGKDYFLDGTDKSLAFGYVQPFANVKEGRVFDYTVIGRDDMGYEQYKGGYWQNMIHPETSSKIVNHELDFSLGEGFFGKLNIRRSGYEALNLRRELLKSGTVSREKLYDQNSNIYEIVDFKLENEKEKERDIEETISFQWSEDEIEELNSKQVFRFLPVQRHIFSENPFTSESRQHPIDFIYPRNFKYRFSFTIPEGYDVKNLPISQRFLFPEKGGSYLYQIQKSSNKVRIFINLKIIQTYYSSGQYAELKKLFDAIYKLERTSLELIKL